ncbi:FtsX-like permease family protein [Ideonella sp. DXS29W]|uniref:FtsX-like permease family protein n=1 Tax=Ideonella lacteola TaxID=2984193 RepID=A0ABU9BWV0_9BURK
MNALLRDAWSGVRHRRMAAWVSVAGLTLAFTASLLVGLLAIALASTDPSIPDPERTIVLDFKGNPPGQPSPWFTASPVSFGTMLRERGAPLDLIARTSGDGMDVTVGDRLEQVFPLLADPEIVPLFDLKPLAGDLRATLASRDGVAVTPHLIRRLWGDMPPSEAMGKTFDVRGVVYTVTAVVPEMDPRHPLDQGAMYGRPHDLIAGFESQANSKSEAERRGLYMVNGRVYARLRDGARADDVGRWMREAFVASPLFQELPPDWRTGREAAYFRGLPLAQLPFEGETAELTWMLAGALGAACGLLLLMAAFNHMNLQAASLLQRQRETALRRSLGADGAALLRLWGLEALLPLVASAAAALLLAWWVAPAVASWMNLPSTLPVADPLPPMALAGLAAAVLTLWPLTLAAPAWLALRRPAAPALQGRTASEGPWGRRVRQALLALQLGGALMLLSLAGVLAAQQYHLLHVDRGFDPKGRLWLGVLINPELVPNLDAFTQALDHHPAVLSWAMSDMRPARDTDGGRKELIVSASRARQVLRLSTVSPRFFETWGMKLLAGQAQMGQGETAMVIDAKAAQMLGFASPQAAVGALVTGGGGFLQEGQEPRRIVAVIDSVKLESARDPALPQGFLLSDRPQWDLSIHGRDLATLHRVVEELWTAHGPKVPHTVQSAEEQLGEVYAQEAQFTAMLAAVALLAVGVAMSGAYALVADTLRRRRTELVLHRLHGAGTLDMARQVMAEFALPVGAAMVLGLPLAAWLGELYLDGFVERIGATAGLFAPLAAAAFATLLVTTLSALRHLRLALGLEPIEALR